MPPSINQTFNLKRKLKVYILSVEIKIMKGCLETAQIKKALKFYPSLVIKTPCYWNAKVLTGLLQIVSKTITHF